MNYLGLTYEFCSRKDTVLISNHRFYDIFFTPVFKYEVGLNLSAAKKIDLLSKIIDYLSARNIHVTFTDRVIEDTRPWENQDGKAGRYLPVAELQGNNICINARNIDFISILFSIGHIYGHLVQRMEEEKYRPITRFVDLPKPLDLDAVLHEYGITYGGDFKADFLEFEKEAFAYAKHAFLQSGILFDAEMEYLMNVYIETDFNELWKWVTLSPQKSGNSFMDEFQRLYHCNKVYDTIPAKEIEVVVIPDEDGILKVVRDFKC